MNSMNCCFVTPRIEWASRRSLAALKRPAWISSKAAATVRASPSSGAGALPPVRRPVARSDLEPQRHALRLPLEVFGARLHVVTQIELDTDARSLEVRLYPTPDPRHLTPFFFGLPDRHDDDLHRREPGWADEAVVVGVGHHQPPDHAGRNPPGGVPGVLEAARGGLILQVERLGEVL